MRKLLFLLLLIPLIANAQGSGLTGTAQIALGASYANGIVEVHEVSNGLYSMVGSFVMDSTGATSIGLTQGRTYGFFACNTSGYACLYTRQELTSYFTNISGALLNGGLGGGTGVTQPGGNTGTFQYNNAGAFGGIAGLTFSGTTMNVGTGYTLQSSGGSLIATSIPWTGVTGTPTTLAGYGVTAVPWSTITGTPTTLAGYGISSPLPVSQGGSGGNNFTGILKGTGTTAFTTAASADIIALWTGTCNNTTFLRADGSCQAGTSTTSWSALTAPTATLALAMGTTFSEFSYNSALGTSNDVFQWDAVPTAATATQSQPSPHIQICGNAWHAGASTSDCWGFEDIPGNGADAPITFQIQHFGNSTGQITTTFPGPIQSGPSGGVGGTVLMPEGTAPTQSAGSDLLYADSTAHRVKASFNNGTFFNIPQVIANGATAMGTTAVGSGACASLVTAAATGVATTDVIILTPNADIHAVTGWGATTGTLTVYPYPTANNVNFLVCNFTSASITPGAVTLNWAVMR